MPLKSWEELSPEEKLAHHERMDDWVGGLRKKPFIRKKYKVKNIGDRFFAKVQKTDSCWLWVGFRNSLGYGDFWVGRGKHMNAPRVSWMLHNGEIPKEIDVCHKCDNPRCVNPEHLWLGTAKDNLGDMFQKKRNPNRVEWNKLNRHRIKFNEDRYNCKITANQVLEMRSKYIPRKGMCKVWAKKYHTTEKYIIAIVCGRKRKFATNNQG